MKTCVAPVGCQCSDGFSECDCECAYCMGDSDAETPCNPNAAGARLCGKPATTTRTVEDVVCALCAEHAAEIDAERGLGTT